MATIGTGTVSYLNTPRRSYITTAPFQNNIYRYTTSLNPTTFQTTGTLTSLASVGTATAANCPANRILRENGKKLYPSGIVVANNTTYGAPNPGVTTYMVGVYDPVTSLNGFIDPNSKVFAPYNTDKPEYVARGIDPSGSIVDLGPPVYTLGTVTAGTGMTTTSGQIRSTTVTPITYSATPNIDISLGQVFTMSVTGNAAITASNPTAGAVVYLVITSDGSIRTITGTGIVKMASVNTTASKITTIGFVSDGTNLYQFSAATSA